MLAARNGITRVATNFLMFKAEELRNYAETQWKLLEDNQLAGNPEFVAVSKTAVESFARSLLRGRGRLIRRRRRALRSRLAGTPASFQSLISTGHLRQ